MEYPFTKQGDGKFAVVPVQSSEAKLAKMIKCFADDYVKIDNVGRIADQNVHDLVTEHLPRVMNTGRQFFYITVAAHTVGYLELMKNSQGDLCLEVIYVKPEYRGNGVAERTYRYAIQEMGVTAMEITYQRVNTPAMADYFNSIGFKSITMIPGQYGGPRGLCALYTYTPSVGTNLIPMNFRGVREAMHHSNKVNTKINKKMLTLDQIDEIRQVVDNHFKSKKIKGQVEEAA